jgi:hypothetical protein
VVVWSKLLTFKLINNCLPTTDVGEGSLGIAEEHHSEAREGRIERTSSEIVRLCVHLSEGHRQRFGVRAGLSTDGTSMVPAEYYRKQVELLLVWAMATA